MFEWINKQGVRSTDGFVLQRMSRYYYHYIDGADVLRVGVEPGLKRSQVSLPSQAFWEPPRDTEQVTSEELDKIEARLHEALTFMGRPYSIIRS